MNVVAPYTTTLTSGNAYWMARMAAEVYTPLSKKDPRPDEKAILKNLKSEDNKFKSVKSYSKNSAQAALIEHADYVCMAFRGTDEVGDWFDNVNAFSHKVLFGEFHRGFWTSLEDVWPGLAKRYGTLMNRKVRPIFFTGHSLGGAMATLAAAKFVHDDKPFTSVYTFGQPRAMDRETSRIFNMECKSRFHRFQNNTDLVTRVPTRLMGYSHVGSFVYISQEETLHTDPGFWYKFVDYFDGVFDDVLKLGLAGIKDHDMEKYMGAVKRWECEF